MLMEQIIEICIHSSTIMYETVWYETKAGFILRMQIYAVYADHFAHVGRVFLATLLQHANVYADLCPPFEALLTWKRGLSLANSPRPLRIRKLLRGI